MSRRQHFLLGVLMALVVQVIEEATGVGVLGLLELVLSVVIAVTGYRWAKQPFLCRRHHPY